MEAHITRVCDRHNATPTAIVAAPRQNRIVWLPMDKINVLMWVQLIYTLYAWNSVWGAAYGEAVYTRWSAVTRTLLSFSLMLSAVSGEDAQDRKDRTILTPWLKFVWESYRQCLDLLRTSSRLERLYHDVAQMGKVFMIL